MFGYPLKFIIGILLLLTNQLVGLSGIAMCSYLSRTTKRKIFYVIGVGIYVFSWIMLLAGVLLAGPDGISMVRKAIALYRVETVLIITLLLVTGVIVYVRKRIKAEKCPVIMPEPDPEA